MPSQSNKMSTHQKIILLEWLEEPENRWITNSSARGRPTREVMQKWQEVAQILNNFRGTKKTAERWKKAFGELRSHIKKKHCVYISQKKTGNKFAAALSEVDQRYLKLFVVASDDETSPPALTEDVWLQSLDGTEEEVAWPDSDDEDQRSDWKCKKYPTLDASSPLTEQCSHPESNIEFAAAAWAIKLNRMNSRQRLMTEKLVNEILIEGILGNLHRDFMEFKLTLQGVLNENEP